MIEIIKLEDRILFEAAAVAEIAEAMENDPNANMNESDRQAQEEKDAIKNAPVENAAAQGAQPDMSNPSDKSDIDAEIQALIEGEIAFSDAGAQAVDDAIQEVFGDFGANAVEDTIHDAFEEKELVQMDIYNSDTYVTTDRELVIINSSVQDMDQIIGSLGANQDVLVLESGRDAMAQINEYLDASGTEYSAIHIVSHGNAGYIALAGERYNTANFEADAWAAVGEHLSDGGDIMIYGCNLAENEAGRDFVALIADATGADVAASTDATGLSGNWVLEYNHGEIGTVAITVDNYEHDLTSITYTVVNDSDIDDMADNEDNMSLRKAFRLANANTTDEDIFIEFSDSLTSITLDSQLSYSNIDAELTVDGSVSAGKIIITVETPGVSAYRVLETGNGTSVNLNNMVMKGGDITVASGMGGVISAGENSTLTLYNSTARDSKSDVGGIYSHTGGNITLTNSLVTENTGTSNGGGVFCNGDLTVSNSTISNNTAIAGAGIIGGGLITVGNGSFITGNTTTGGAGGGILGFTGSEITVSGSTVSNNTSSIYGGGIYAYADSKITVTDSTISDNTVNGQTQSWGGGIFGLENCEITVTGGTISGNEALYGGGVGGYTGTTIKVEGVDITGNKSLWGGGIFCYTGASLTVINSKITQNNADENGGGIFSASQATVTGSTISNNTSGNNGGGIFNYTGMALTVTDSTISGNKTTNAGGAGGGICVMGSAVIERVTFDSNSSESGGAIFLNSATSHLAVNNSTFFNNTATGAGAALCINDGTATLANSTVYGSNGDAIYGNLVVRS